MRRALCALAVLAMLAAACGGSQPAASPTPEATTSPEPPAVAALTGEGEGGDELRRPVLAVKVDNAAAALPQLGLDAADIVFEEEVEGGITRFLVLYHSRDPGQVAPVRSGREVDADLLPPFAPLFAISGAAEVVDELFASAGLAVFEDDDYPEAFSRMSDRAAPHNVLLEAAPLWADGGDQPVPAEDVWTFDATPPAGGEPVTTASLRFSPAHLSAWTWNGEQWERWQNGVPHQTPDGAPLTADNVVVMRVVKTPGDRRDSAGNPTVALEVLGSGDASVLRDGRMFAGTWSKDAPADQLTWSDVDGQPLALKPGRSWVELLATDASLDVESETQTE